MRNKTYVPPIKSQGIKTKLIPWINDLLFQGNISINSNWIEPFFGTGVVGFNSPFEGKRIVGDTNPHIINFYKKIQKGEITKYTMREYLEEQSKKLFKANDNGYEYYKEVRCRFNNEGFDPYDFIFLSRAGFNGMMRFNKKGEWNIPFCKKPDRFSPAYITKICNQIENISKIIHSKNWTFLNADFEKIISFANNEDLIYCDPPYYGRCTDYYNGWSENDEYRLYNALKTTKSKFILSTWHHNDFRENLMIKKYWGDFNIITKDHFYHNGGNIENRRNIVEALVFNFDINNSVHIETIQNANQLQLELFT